MVYYEKKKQCRKKYLIFTCACAVLILASFVSSWADAQTKPNRFIFTLSVKSALISEGPKGTPKDIHLVTLKKVAPKTQYFIYPPIKQAGYVKTNDLLKQWLAWAKKVKRPLPVVIKIKNKKMLTGLLPIKSIATNSRVFYSIKPDPHALVAMKLPLSTPLKEGSYSNITISSDMLPIDIKSLPHSVCSLSMSIKECKQKPLE